MNTRLTMLSVLAAHAGVAHAQWTVTNLHPAGAASSGAGSTNGAQQAGAVTLEVPGTPNTLPHASLWSGTAESWVDLGSSSSVADMSGNQQVGYRSAPFPRATLWTGTAASRVDLQPTGANESTAYATNGVQQVGYVRFGNANRSASLWSGTAESYVNLQPAGANMSFAYAINGTQQGGYVHVPLPGNPHSGVDRACLWYGTAESWVDLSPAGATWSSVRALSDTQQGGEAFVAGVRRASLWSGTAASWVDLSPAGASESFVWDMSHSYQVGVAYVDGVGHAGLWSGTSESWVDLHLFLPAEFTGSSAYGVWSDDTHVHVTGGAFNAVTNRSEAIMWTRLLPSACIADVDNDGDFVNGLTRDGAVTIEDLLSFLVGFEASNVLADLDNGTSTGTPDNAVDISDLLYFLARFEAGC